MNSVVHSRGGRAFLGSQGAFDAVKWVAKVGDARTKLFVAAMETMMQRWEISCKNEICYWDKEDGWDSLLQDTEITT